MATNTRPIPRIAIVMAPLPEFLTFAAVGVFAQLVDGALGMAYGVVSAAMLLGLGLPPALASGNLDIITDAMVREVTINKPSLAG